MKRPMMECPECDGKGEVVHPGLGLPYTTTCKFCGGLGKVRAPNRSSQDKLPGAEHGEVRKT